MLVLRNPPVAGDGAETQKDRVTAEGGRKRWHNARIFRLGKVLIRSSITPMPYGDRKEVNDSLGVLICENGVM
jgi:hypothetical protein